MQLSRLIGLVCVSAICVSVLSGCGTLKKVISDANPLSSTVILVTSPNVVSVPVGKTVTVSATLEGALPSEIDFNHVSISSSKPEVAEVTLERSTSPYLFVFKAKSVGKTFITFRFDNNPNTDLTLETHVYQIANVEDATAQSRNSGAHIKWTVPTESHGVSVNIYRNTINSFTSENLIASVPLTNISYTENGLVNGTVYYYKLEVVDAEGFQSSGVLLSVTPLSDGSDNGSSVIPDDSPLNSIPDNSSNQSETETPSGNSGTVPSNNTSPSSNNTGSSGSSGNDNSSVSINLSPEKPVITNGSIVGYTVAKIDWAPLSDTDITEISIIQNGTVIHTISPVDSNTPHSFSTAALPDGSYIFSIRISDGVNPPVESDPTTIVINNSIPAISQLAASVISVDGSGMQVRLQWTNPSVSISGVEIRRSATPNPESPTDHAADEVLETISGVTDNIVVVLPFSTQPVYLDVRIKDGATYSRTKQEIAVFPSSWETLSHSEKTLWDNRALFETDGHHLSTGIWVDAVVESADIANGKAVKLAIHAPGFDLRTATSISIAEPEIGVYERYATPETTTYSHNGQTAVLDLVTPTHPGYNNELPVGYAYRIDIGFEPGNFISTYAFIHERATPEIISDSVDGHYSAFSGRKQNGEWVAHSLSIQNGIATLELPSGAQLIGTVHLVNRTQGYIQLTNATGVTVGRLPFSYYESGSFGCLELQLTGSTKLLNVESSGSITFRK